MIPTASAGYFSWEGTIGRGKGLWNCPWYQGQSACSGWNYWYGGHYKIRLGGDTELSGWENFNTIRGVYIQCCGLGGYPDEAWLSPSQLSLGGMYLRTHMTWCSWRPYPDCALDGDGTNVFFESWA